MSNDTAIPFFNPAFADALTGVLRDGAQQLIKRTVQAELDAFLDAHADTDDADRRQVVRNGYQPERDGLTGLGPIPMALHANVN